MDFRNRLRGIFVVAVLLSAADSAHALTINMSFIEAAWSNVVIDTPNTLTGEGTNEITWNMPSNDGDHSGFRFNHFSQLSTQTNTEFSLGEFTYFNYPAMGEDLDTADLYIHSVLDIAGTVVTADSLNVPFSLHQISGNCGNPNCTRDQVKLKGARSIGTFNAGGIAYSLDILGFRTNGQLKNVLHVFDNDRSTASLIARFTPTAIPEPGTFGLLLVGFTALFWSRRRLARLSH
ncbi:MAG: PEP-CTERM sorting domain-containing protein [Gammaproteobacteria bacterium]|nr:PEP-CTERM sorting domain-containing protein [Gammaproteobacteria bacterium]